MKLSRRAALAAGLATPFVARAQGEPIRIGTLTPLTGAGGPYGPSMVKSMQAVAEAVNSAGGVLGRRIQLVSEDSQTNPDAAVRAGRKLIDVDRVPAICGTWASAVTTAVAPLCWENRTMLFTVSGADSITQLPHQGYIIRTQPNTKLQNTRVGKFMVAQGVKKLFVLGAQTPFAVPGYQTLTEVLAANGSQTVGHVIYDKDKANFRSEVDQALRTRPDMIFLNGYTPDVTIVMRELFRAGFDGKRMAPEYAINVKLLEGLPAEVTEGALNYAPSPDLNSPAFKAVSTILGTGTPDTYSCQTYDQFSLAVLAIAKAGAVSGTAIHGAVRKISQGNGEKVTSAVDGLKLLAAGKEINYEGASGPCDFLDSGDIIDCKFRFDIAEKGKFRTLELS